MSGPSDREIGASALALLGFAIVCVGLSIALRPWVGFILFGGILAWAATLVAFDARKK